MRSKLNAEISENGSLVSTSFANSIATTLASDEGSNAVFTVALSHGLIEAARPKVADRWPTAFPVVLSHGIIKAAPARRFPDQGRLFTVALNRGRIEA